MGGQERCRKKDLAVDARGRHQCASPNLTERNRPPRSIVGADRKLDEPFRFQPACRRDHDADIEAAQGAIRLLNGRDGRLIRELVGEGFELRLLLWRNGQQGETHPNGDYQPRDQHAREREEHEDGLGRFGRDPVSNLVPRARHCREDAENPEGEPQDEIVKEFPHGLRFPYPQDLFYTARRDSCSAADRGCATPAPAHGPRHLPISCQKALAGVERHVKETDQKHYARSALERPAGAEREQNSQTRTDGLGNRVKRRVKSTEMCRGGAP